MKNIFSLNLRICYLLILLGFIVNSCSDDSIETPTTPPPSKALFDCVNGMAGEYPCNGYDLMARVSAEELGGPNTEGNDSWGWTDPTTGNEYAIVGTTKGTVFINITDTQNLIILGTLPTQIPGHSRNTWRDIKVYDNYAFIVSEAPNHGMQIFDLTRLRNVVNIPETFTTDAHYTGFGSSHNLVINETSGYAYAVGIRSPNQTHIVNIQDPLNPIAAGTLLKYNHDAQVVNYTGPDVDYIGKEILVGSNESEIVIADVSDKTTPIIISTLTYNNIKYTHQGWFTDDLKYFIVGDELDERDFGINTRTLIFDFTDLDNPVLHNEYTGPTAAIDHNGYVKGDTYYLANYTAGVRFINISDIENKNLVEEGFFDTYPLNDNTGFEGVWNVYPFFESGNIIVNNFDGFFIVRKSGT